MAIEEVMYSMVLPVETITVKTVLSDWSHTKRRWEQGIELMGDVSLRIDGLIQKQEYVRTQ